MKKLEKFVDDNFDRFSNLEDGEVIELSPNYVDAEIVEYLKNVSRFDYKGICVYYEEDENEIWIENMSVEN